MADATTDTESRLKEQLENLRTSYTDGVIEPRSTARTRTEILFVFEVGPAAFGFTVDHLTQILPARGIVAVPSAPAHVAGAIAYRQQAVSVVDLKALLDIARGEEAESQWVLVLRPASAQWALAADAMLGVRKIDAAELDLVSKSEASDSIVAGGLTIDGRPVVILDVEALAQHVAPA